MVSVRFQFVSRLFFLFNHWFVQRCVLYLLHYLFFIIVLVRDLMGRSVNVLFHLGKIFFVVITFGLMLMLSLLGAARSILVN